MIIKNLKEPFVIILIGPPLSGKSTWIRENFPTTEVISRDEIVMEVYGSRNYTEAFKSVDQKEVDKVKTDKAKAAKTETLNKATDHIDNHTEEFKTTFDVHKVATYQDVLF